MPMFDKRDVVGKDIVSNRLDCFSIYSLMGGSIWSSRASDLYVSSEETRFYSGNVPRECLGSFELICGMECRRDEDWNWSWSNRREGYNVMELVKVPS